MATRIDHWSKTIFGDGDRRIVRIVVGALAAAPLAVGAFAYTGVLWWLLVAAIALVVVAMAILILEDEKQRRAERLAERYPKPRAPVLPTAAPPAAPVEPPAPPRPLPMSRVYRESLQVLLSSDFSPLPPGHVWPDLGRIRGSLATRALLSQQVGPSAPVPAAATTAPLYVSYARMNDVATGLHTAALWHRGNPLVVLMDASLQPGLAPAERLGVDDTVVQAWFGLLAGTLTPPPLLTTLVAIGNDPSGPGGAYVLELLEQLRIGVRSVRTADAAARRWALWRAHLALEAQRGAWSAVQVAGAELTADWLLLQRSMADDLAAAERDRLEGETRGDALVRADTNGSFGFEGTLALLLDPASVSRLAPEEARAAGELLTLPLISEQRAAAA